MCQNGFILLLAFGGGGEVGLDSWIAWSLFRAILPSLVLLPILLALATAVCLFGLIAGRVKQFVCAFCALVGCRMGYGDNSKWRRRRVLIKL